MVICCLAEGGLHHPAHTLPLKDLRLCLIFRDPGPVIADIDLLRQAVRALCSPASLGPFFGSFFPCLSSGLSGIIAAEHQQIARGEVREGVVSAELAVHGLLVAEQVSGGVVGFGDAPEVPLPRQVGVGEDILRKAVVRQGIVPLPVGKAQVSRDLGELLILCIDPVFLGIRSRHVLEGGEVVRCKEQGAPCLQARCRLLQEGIEVLTGDLRKFLSSHGPGLFCCQSRHVVQKDLLRQLRDHHHVIFPGYHVFDEADVASLFPKTFRVAESDDLQVLCPAVLHIHASRLFRDHAADGAVVPADHKDGHLLRPGIPFHQVPPAGA